MCDTDLSYRLSVRPGGTVPYRWGFFGGRMGKFVNITIIGEINSEMLSSVLEQVQKARVKKAGLKVLISSEGGAAADAIAIASTLRRYPGTVHTHGTGLVASAATLILAAGTSGCRSIDSTAWLMVHEEQVELSGSISQVLSTAIDLKRQEDQWCEMLSTYTGKPLTDLIRLHAMEKYLTANEALSWGFIDEVKEIK